MLPLMELAMQQINVGDLAAAENVIQVIEDSIADTEDQQHWADVMKLHGRVALRQHDWLTAFDFISAALGHSPDDIDGHLLLGMATMELGGFESAANEFREVILRNG